VHQLIFNQNFGSCISCPLWAFVQQLPTLNQAGEEIIFYTSLFVSYTTKDPNGQKIPLTLLNAPGTPQS